MTAMVKAHSKDDVLWYYASLLLAQFEGAEDQSHISSPTTVCQAPQAVGSVLSVLYTVVVGLVVPTALCTLYSMT